MRLTPALRGEGSTFIVALAAFVAVNLLLFATPFYRSLVEPNSTTLGGPLGSVSARSGSDMPT